MIRPQPRSVTDCGQFSRGHTTPASPAPGVSLAQPPASAMPQELKQERPHPGACAWWAPSVERAKKPNETFRASRPEGRPPAWARSRHATPERTSFRGHTTPTSAQARMLRPGGNSGTKPPGAAQPSRPNHASRAALRGAEADGRCCRADRDIPPSVANKVEAARGGASWSCRGR